MRLGRFFGSGSSSPLPRPGRTVTRRARAAAALAGLGAVLVATEAGAFATLDGVRTAWPRNPSYRITNSSPDIRDGSDGDAIRRSFQVWQDVPTASISFQAVARGGDITVSFLQQWPREFGPDAAGVTLTSRQGGVISAAEVSMNNANFTWTTTGAADGTDVEGVATHEIGHAIGLDHSRTREATMYWSGGDQELRSLHEDDERALTFLYGNWRAQGVVCDTCEQDGDCANGGLCLVMQDGLAFCGQPCGAGNACAAGAACFNLRNGDTQCAPEEGFCSDGGGTGTLAEGAYCWGADQCQRGTQCIALPDGPAACMGECASDRDCARGTACLGAEAGQGYCVPQGDVAFGGNCSASFDCASLLCVPIDDNVNVCSQDCNPAQNDCPGGVECVAVEDVPGLTGLCVPGGNVREGGECGDAANRCSGGLTCIQETAGGAPICRAACDPFGVCARGRGCTPYNADDWFCLPTTGATAGEACDPNALDCAGGLLCLPTSDDAGQCVQPCDDRADGTCDGHTCYDLDGAAGNLGACSPGTAEFGETCDLPLDCAEFLCVSDGDRGVCSQTCSDLAPCPRGFACMQTRDGDRLCFRDSGGGEGGSMGTGGEPGTGGNPGTGGEPAAGGNAGTGGDPGTGGEPGGPGGQAGTGGQTAGGGGESAGAGGNAGGPGTNGGGVTDPDAGTSNGATVVTKGGGSSGGCQTTPGGRGRTPALWGILGALALTLRRRRAARNTQSNFGGAL